MSYVANSLHDGETVYFEARYFWFERWKYIGAYVLGVLTLASGVGVLFFAYAVYKQLTIRCTERAVTNWRVIQKRGIVSVETEEIMMSSIETITIHQSITERLMGGGTVKVTGRGGIVIDINDVDDPITVKKAIEQQRLGHGSA
jgi:uncharacterized membrane protein YdbT with pleckstrin-like domain